MYSTKISSQRQIVLPKPLMKKLKLKKHDRLHLSINRNKLVVEPRGERSIEDLSGVLLAFVKPELRGKPFKEIINVTKIKIAKKLAYD